MNTCTNAGQAPARTAAPMSVAENQVDGRPQPDERTTKYCELWPKIRESTSDRRLLGRTRFTSLLEMATGGAATTLRPVPRAAAVVRFGRGYVTEQHFVYGQIAEFVLSSHTRTNADPALANADADCERTAPSRSGRFRTI
jgi:hypothetical protein